MPHAADLLRTRVHDILEIARPGDRVSAAFDAALFTLILLNVAAVVVESVQHIRMRAPGFFTGFETFSVAVFTVEYILRLWSCTAEPRFAQPLRGRLRYALRPLPLIDLAAILPSLLLIAGLDLRFMRILRLFRLLRVGKLARYSEAMQLIGRAFHARRRELAATAVVAFMAMLFAASLMYYAERDAQPEHFGSIPAAAWWAVITLTTVGYGDIYPVTAAGRALAAVVAALGIGMFAFPTGVLGAAFMEQLAKRRARQAQEAAAGPRCPACGRPLEGPPA
jgi:voltage-gated potassium channel